MTMQRRGDFVVVERVRRIMATRMSVHLAVPPGDEARGMAAIERCLAWLGEVGDRLTRFDAMSELSRLNAAVGQWFRASKLLYAVVAESLAAAEASGGLFDPGLLGALEAIGYDRDFDELCEAEIPVRAARAMDAHGVGGWRGIELDAGARRIRLPPGVRLDLGGIVKGWAADQALERCFGTFAHVLINASGDMRVRGGPEEDGCWALGIGDPRAMAAEVAEAPERGGAPADRVVLTLGQGGMATSGATTRWWYHGGQRQHHLIDPRSGSPARLWIDARDDGAPGEPLVATATALAPTAAHAEVAAKAALLRGHPAALTAVGDAWQAEPGGGARTAYGDDEVALILLLGSGEVVCSANLTAYLASLGGGGAVWLD